MLVREYRFGARYVNAIAVGLPGRGLMLVSPPVRVPASELKELEQFGDVTALLEFKGAHHMGLAPDRQEGQDPGPIEPLEALHPKLGDRISAAGNVVLAHSCADEVHAGAAA